MEDAIISITDFLIDWMEFEHPFSLRKWIREQETRWRFTLRDGILRNLDGPILFYNSSSDGPLGLGAVIAFRVKNPGQLQANLHNAVRDSSRAIDFRSKWSEETIGGDKFYQIHVKNVLFIPTYTIKDRWLFVGIMPQSIKGVLLRYAGKAKQWDYSQPEAKAFLENVNRTRLRYVSATFRDESVSLRLLFEFLPAILCHIGLDIVDSWDLPEFNIGLLPHTQEITDMLTPSLSVWTAKDNDWRMDSVTPVHLPIGISSICFSIYLFRTLCGG